MRARPIDSCLAVSRPGNHNQYLESVAGTSTVDVTALRMCENLCIGSNLDSKWQAVGIGRPLSPSSDASNGNLQAPPAAMLCGEVDEGDPLIATKYVPQSRQGSDQSRRLYHVSRSMTLGSLHQLQPRLDQRLLSGSLVLAICAKRANP